MHTQPATVEFGQIRPILKSAEASGVKMDRVLALLGLHDGVEATDARTHLNLADYFRIQRDIARSLDDLTAQLSERKLTYRTGDFVISQIQQARTLQDAVNSLADYFNMMHGDAYNSVRRNSDTLSLIVDDSTFPYRFRHDDALTHFVGDCLLIKVHCLLDSLSNGLAAMALRRVRLQRSRQAEGSRQNDFWSVPVQYGWAVYELVYDFETACQPIPRVQQVDLSTDGIFARVINHLDRMSPNPVVQSFKARTLDLINEGTGQQGDVARMIGVSVATLRRRLGDEGTSFRALLSQSRFEQAEALLIKGVSVAQVAEQLEYSDIRAFNRAFKTWRGQTPATFARQMRA